MTQLKPSKSDDLPCRERPDAGDAVHDLHEKGVAEVLVVGGVPHRQEDPWMGLSPHQEACARVSTQAIAD